MIAPFRDVFTTYELLAYLSYRGLRFGYRCIEPPTIRRYPKGEVATKISSIRRNMSVFAILIRACTSGYDSPRKSFPALLLKSSRASRSV
jgi:dolichol-phosphate mannosyltransferase